MYPTEQLTCSSISKDDRSIFHYSTFSVDIIVMIILHVLQAGVWYNLSPCERCMCQNNNLLCSRLDDCVEPSTEPTIISSELPTVKDTPKPMTTIDPYDQIQNLIRYVFLFIKSCIS